MTDIQVDLLITAHLRGELAVFPRVYTVLQALKKKMKNPVYLLDTGAAWSSDVWICQVTANRAPYFVMDSMGYDVIFADGLNPISWEIVKPKLQTQLVMPPHWAIIHHDEFHLNIKQNPKLENPKVVDGILGVDLPPVGKVRQLTVTVEKATIIHNRLFDMDTRNSSPDPAVSATVEFVEHEAREYHEKQQKDSGG